MKGLSDRQAFILQHIIEQSSTLCPPTMVRLAECAEVSVPIVRAALKGLLKKGYVKLAYTSGPYIPLKDADGNDLEWTLVKKAA